MKKMIWVAFVGVMTACGEPIGGEGHPLTACDGLQFQVPSRVTASNWTQAPEFVLMPGGVVCYAPGGHRRDDTCGPEVFLQCLGQQADFTYCPAGKHAVYGDGPSTATSRPPLVCVAD